MKKKIMVFFIVLVLVSLGLAQDPVWVRTGGPWGGIGYDIRIDPNNPDIMFVTDQWAGNHKSTNGGATWYPNNTGIQSVFGSTGQSVPIFCLTIDPNNSDNVWCGTFENKGIYRSTDGGESWEIKIEGIPDFQWSVTFRGLGIRPGNSNVIFCAMEVGADPQTLPEGQESASRGKVFKSIDFGESWVEVIDSDALCRHIVFNPNNPDVMYVSTGIFDRENIQSEGIWKSTDGGELWFKANNGLNDLDVGGLAIDPNNPDVLWASTGREAGFGGDNNGEIYKSSDGGESWQQMYPPAGQTNWHINSIALSGTNSDVIYAAEENGFLVSRDAGLHWTMYRYNIPGVYAGIPVGIAAHPTVEDIVFINSYSGGVFASWDGGRNWSIYSNGYTGAEMLDVVVSPEDPLQVTAAGRSGISKSDDGGTTWQGAGQSGHHHGIGEMHVLEMDPQNSQHFLCSARWSSDLIQTHNRYHWQSVFNFDTYGVAQQHGIGTIEFGNQDASIVFVGVTTSSLPFIIDRPIGPYPDDLISYGIFRSQDGGNDFQPVTVGLESTTKNIQKIVVHPTDDNIVYACIWGSGVFKSTDGGDSWNDINSGLLSYRTATLTIDGQNPETVYVGLEDGGIYKSQNGGTNWTPKLVGMDPEASIRSIAIDPTQPDIVYASDWRTGVYRSTNSGDSWTDFNKGLIQRSVQKLALSHDGKVLYAATQGSGVFRLSFENRGPTITYRHPDNASKVTIQKGDSALFVVGAQDFNGDALTYTWTLDGSSLNKTDPIYSLQTDDMGGGDYTLTCQVSDGMFTTSVTWTVEVIDNTSVCYDISNHPITFSLDQNRPNPFNPVTMIRFGLPVAGPVQLDIYDVRGRHVHQLFDGWKQAGYHELVWDGESLSTGIYYYVFRSGNYKNVKKALLMK